ncbi:MAG: hypothetical protein RL095_4011 [Verrucomicrobiota bacterium]|jgi:glycosyltransferase involved in cell wall biosynthesis
MLLSVIIPAYNYGHFLPRSVGSVLSQLPEDAELLIVDDGSTDQTESIVRQWHDEPRFRYFRQVNGGPAKARNQGLALARGEFCLMLDADDELLPGALQPCLRLLQESRADFLIASSVSRHEDGREKSQITKPLPASGEERFLMYLDKDASLQTGYLILRTQVARSVGFPEDLRAAEDLSYFSRLLLKHSPITSEIPLCRVYHHAGSLRTNVEKQRLYNVRAAEAIFDPAHVPPSLLGRKPRYLSQRHLSLARILFKNGFPAEGRGEYLAALRLSPASLLRFDMMRRYLLSFFRRRKPEA